MAVIHGKTGISRYSVYMANNDIWKLLRYIALAGNAVFFFWIIINGINEGFKGTPVEKVSYVVLLALLAINFALIYKRH